MAFMFRWRGLAQDFEPNAVEVKYNGRDEEIQLASQALEAALIVVRNIAPMFEVEVKGGGTVTPELEGSGITLQVMVPVTQPETAATDEAPGPIGPVKTSVDSPVDTEASVGEVDSAPVEQPGDAPAPAEAPTAENPPPLPSDTPPTQEQAEPTPSQPAQVS